MELVEANNDATLEELCEQLQHQSGITITRATMGRITQRLNLTVKKRLHATQRDSERVQQLPVEFWQQMRTIDVHNLVLSDEARVNLAMVRLYARALRGQRAYGTRPQHRGKNVTMIGAIGLRGVIASVNLLRATDGLTFEAFIVQRLIPKLWPGACVVLDNRTAHKGDEIEAALRAAGAQLVYLLPYSPDFSPMENFWSKVKSRLRCIRARTYLALEQAITQAFNQVSVQDIHNWFTHCCYCTSLT